MLLTEPHMYSRFETELDGIKEKRRVKEAAELNWNADFVKQNKKEIRNINEN